MHYFSGRILFGAEVEFGRARNCDYVTWAWYGTTLKRANVVRPGST